MDSKLISVAIVSILKVPVVAIVSIFKVPVVVVWPLPLERVVSPAGQWAMFSSGLPVCNGFLFCCSVHQVWHCRCAFQ